MQMGTADMRTAKTKKTETADFIFLQIRIFSSKKKNESMLKL